MNLQECLTKLARGKISNLPFCVGGYVKPEFLEKVIDAVNESLNRLYTVFNIDEQSIEVPVEDKHIEYPLKGNILYVTRVHDNLGHRYAINNPEERCSVFVTSVALTADLPEGVTSLKLFYRVKPEELTAEDFESEINIPDNLIGALLSYSAYLLHSDLNTQTAISNAQKYLVEYQTVVNEVIQQGTIVPEAILIAKKWKQRGFV